MKKDMETSADVEGLFHLVQLFEEASEYSDSFDEKIYNSKTQSIAQKEAYLADSLAWEKAPEIPVREWSPELKAAKFVPGDDVRAELSNLLQNLRDARHVVARADHLSDARLYSLLVCRVLPAKQKKIEGSDELVCWDFCSFAETNAAGGRTAEEIEDYNFLVYYASEEERAQWAAKRPGCQIPPMRIPPHRRIY
ncbi:MAG: hypothetical protein HUK22_06585 [Thermoguttaceae bacterium]|nr:hypothetical protein [Thermoguttaceae bacterium]